MLYFRRPTLVIFILTFYYKCSMLISNLHFAWGKGLLFHASAVSSVTKKKEYNWVIHYFNIFGGSLIKNYIWNNGFKIQNCLMPSSDILVYSYLFSIKFSKLSWTLDGGAWFQNSETPELLWLHHVLYYLHFVDSYWFPCHFVGHIKTSVQWRRRRSSCLS